MGRGHRSTASIPASRPVIPGECSRPMLALGHTVQFQETLTNKYHHQPALLFTVLGQQGDCRLYGDRWAMYVAQELPSVVKSEAGTSYWNGTRFPWYACNNLATYLQQFADSSKEKGYWQWKDSRSLFERNYPDDVARQPTIAVGGLNAFSIQDPNTRGYNRVTPSRGGNWALVSGKPRFTLDVWQRLLAVGGAIHTTRSDVDTFNALLHQAPLFDTGGIGRDPQTIIPLHQQLTGPRQRPVRG